MAEIQTDIKSRPVPVPAGIRQRPQYALLLRLSAIVMLAIMFAMVKQISKDGVHVLEAVFWRQLAGLPIVLIWLYWTGSLSMVATRHPAKHAARMVLGLTAMALNFTAMTMLPLAEATTIGFASGIIATLLAATILREPTGYYRWAAIIIGFVGVLIAMQPGHSNFGGMGAIIALIGAVITSCVAIQLRFMGRTENAGAIVFWFSLCSMVPLLIAMLFVAKPHDTQTWLNIAGMASAGAIAQILLTTSLRYGSVSAVLTMDYTSLLWSALIGYFFFNEIPGTHIYMGAPVIIAAGIIIAWREHVLQRNSVLDQGSGAG
jgi:drug/metabolite transporter (DMT)-like permease